MKSVPSAYTAAAALISVLAIPVWLGAQDEAQHHSPKHHHYKLVEMTTFGGPTSSIDATGGAPTSMLNQILTRTGFMLAGGDTPIPDPDEFAGPFVNYAFRWENGVPSNLGVLPEQGGSGRPPAPVRAEPSTNKETLRVVVLYMAGQHPIDVCFFGDPSGILPVCNAIK